VAAVLTVTHRPKQMQQLYGSLKCHCEEEVHFVKVEFLLNLKRNHLYILHSTVAKENMGVQLGLSS
jgi:hypothetical protein